MAINPVSKAQPMREGEIAAIDALNAALEQLNTLDISTINTRLQAIETNMQNITTRLDAIDGTNGSINALTSRVSSAELDIANVKATLYTNLNQSV